MAGLSASVVAIEICNAVLFAVGLLGLGFGAGLIYMTGMSITLSWFAHRKSMSTALYSTCNGFSALCLQVANTHAIEAYGLKDTLFLLLLMLSAGALICCTLATFGPHRDNISRESLTDRDGDYVQRALSRPKLWFFMFFCLMCWAPGWGAIASLNVLLSETLHVNELHASKLAIAPLVTLLLGRLGTGFVAQVVDYPTIFAMNTASQAIACSILSFSKSTAVVVAMLSVLTTGFGVASSGFAPYALSILGTNTKDLDIGFSLLAYGLSAMVATIAFGLFSASQSFDLMFVVSVFAFTANLCFFDRCGSMTCASPGRAKQQLGEEVVSHCPRGLVPGAL
jgi:hypothetical protein